ncbi:MAG: PpiC-type peptidyl-prolyl cis-trans isomerase [Oscillospiraceae bacterium]|jgi:hypothetical protein|nr:PpiC-type peptidyl-prolyl cis-trans isomerase [Oscillospiraceae bacterium]
MIIKKLAALGLALGMAAVSLSGCGSKSPEIAATYKDGTIPAGVYIFNQVNALNEAYQKVANPYGDILSQDIDGVKVEQWVNNRAVELVKTYAAVASEAARLNVTLDEAIAASIKQSLNKTWGTEGANMEKLGISLASAEAIATNTQLANEVFTAYYGEGGEKAVPESELKTYFTDNYRRALMLVLSKRDNATGATLDSGKLDEQKKLFEDYKARVQAGTPLFDVIVAENDRAKAAAGNTEETPALVESEQEILVNKGNTSYPQALLDQVFTSTKQNTPEFYEDDSYYVIYELRDTLGDGTSFTNAKASLLAAYKGDAFRSEMIALADTLSFKLNSEATDKFKVSKILENQK